MKKITILVLLLLSINNIYSQNEKIYSAKLRHISSINIYSGSTINPGNRFASIDTETIVFEDRSALTLVDCIVKVNGPVDASANCMVRLINAYIICRKYKGPPSNQIIVTNNIANCKISDAKFIKKIKGNPFIEVINKSGKIVIKDYKENLKDRIIKTGVYDIRSAGNFYKKDILLFSN